MSRNRQSEQYAGYVIFFSEEMGSWVGCRKGSNAVLFSGDSKQDVKTDIQESLTVNA